MGLKDQSAHQHRSSRGAKGPRFRARCNMRGILRIAWRALETTMLVFFGAVLAAVVFLALYVFAIWSSTYAFFIF